MKTNNVAGILAAAALITVAALASVAVFAFCSDTESDWIAQKHSGGTTYVYTAYDHAYCYVYVGDTGDVTIVAQEWRDGFEFTHKSSWGENVANIRELMMRRPTVPANVGVDTTSDYRTFDAQCVEPVKKLPKEVQAKFGGLFGIGDK